MGDETNPVSTSVRRKVLELETNDVRFEAFCIEVISALEGGASIFSTSRSWDFGRDGVGGGRAAGLYICCSLRDDVEIKALDDIERISSTTRNIARLYFCSSQQLSEHRISTIEDTLRREVDNAFEVVCLGSSQLTEAAISRAPEAMERQYGPEIKNTLRAIQADPTDDTEQRGLRLALLSAAGDTSTAIRAEVYTSALLDALSDSQPLTVARCAKQISENLRLQRNVAAIAIEPHLRQLVNDGLVAESAGTYEITDAGRQALRARENEAANRLLSGRRLIRDALETAIGGRLGEDQFRNIWIVLEERMAHYFLSRGDAIVAEVADLMNGEAGETHSVPPGSTPLSFLDDLSDAVAATSSHPQQREEIKVAIRDIFTDRTSVATDWLLRLSASFLAACALGLEHASAEALARLLSQTTLVLDTDVVLSLIGEGEGEHSGVQTIVSNWTKMGGTVLVGEPVLEEVAYHASIAQQDYDSVARALPGTPEDRMHLIDNVFVRSFAELLARRDARPSQWRRYIGQFLGHDAHDWQNTLKYISDEYRVGRLPPRSTKEAELEGKVRSFLSQGADQKFEGEGLRNALDKARRDAELYSALVHHVRQLKDANPGATCLLVSSARRLAKAEDTFHESGESNLIISIAGVLYLLSLVPGVSLGLTSMKAFLFDEQRRRFSSDLERSLMRIVKGSHEVSMPWAKRTLLMREVRSRMVKDAQEMGIRHPTNAQIAGIDQAALAAGNQARTMEILKDSLDAIAVDTRLEQENRDLRARLRALEEELASRKAARR